MEAEWHYEQNGQSVGPVSAAEIANKIKEAPLPLFVWRAGMSEWTDAREVPTFSSVFEKKIGSIPSARKATVASPPAQGGAHPTLAQRARHELIAYLTICAYLLIWFSALLFYKATVLGSVGVAFAPFGFAAIKALILGKFILVLEALRLGDKRTGGGILIVEILQRALLFTVALIVLNLIEELAVGYFHGRAAKEVLREIGGGSLSQVFASAILMFLVLIPYLAFRRLASTYGELPELFFARRPPPRQSL